jgi:hypothetical protein
MRSLQTAGALEYLPQSSAGAPDSALLAASYLGGYQT